MNLHVSVVVLRHHLLSDNYTLVVGVGSVRAALHQADCLYLEVLGSFCMYDSSEWRAPSCSTHSDWFTKPFPPSVGVCVSRATLCPLSPAAKMAQIEATTAVGWGCCVWFCFRKHLAVSPSEMDEEAPCAGLQLSLRSLVYHWSLSQVDGWGHIIILLGFLVSLKHVTSMNVENVVMTVENRIASAMTELIKTFVAGSW